MDLLAELKDFAGEAKYEKFIEVLRGQAKTDGRLMFWQEELLDELSQKLGHPIPTDLESILALFRLPSILIDRDQAASQSELMVLNAPVVRLFHWVNQLASGGSHGDLLPFHGLSIGLLDFAYHEIDLHPRKYIPAIAFVLEDLVCELRCGRFIRVKRLGIPI